MDLKESVTIENLMRAFAGESQARNRYIFAAQSAEKEKLYNAAALFRYIAEQEKAHAKIWWNYLRQAGADNVAIQGGFPVDLQTDALSLLRGAVKNETEETAVVYPAFAQQARQDGFPDIAFHFERVGAVEQSHAGKFQRFADLLEQGKLFQADGSVQWICLNCGNLITASEAPAKCPVCHHEQGYFVRVELSPFE